MTVNRTGLLVISAVLFVLAVVYLETLLPGVGYAGDTAKFQFVGKVLGIPHATGYPLYVLLNHLFVTVFPIGSLAYKANLLSVIFALLALFYLFRLLILVEIRPVPAGIAILCFGTTRTLWTQAIIAEVYTLNLLCISLSLFYLYSWHRKGKTSHYYLACLCYALSFGNHLTMITLLPAFLSILIINRRLVLNDPWKVIAPVGFVILGMAEYAFILYRLYDPTTPYVDSFKGEVSLERFFWFITGTDFKNHMFGFTLDDIFLERLPNLLEGLWDEWAVVSLIAIPGSLLSADRTFRAVLVVYFLSTSSFVLGYDIPDIFIYYIPISFVVTIWVGQTLSKLIERISLRPLVVLVSLLLILIPIVQILQNKPAIDAVSKTDTGERIESILRVAGNSSLIISPDYHHSEYFWYYLIGEGYTGKNIFVVHHFDPSQIRDYLMINKSFTLPEERKVLPSGLKVYCLSRIHAALLANQGLSVFVNEKEAIFRITTADVFRSHD